MAEPHAIEIGAQRMVDGMFELFDELGDLALNRVVRLTRDLEGGFNPTLVTPDNVNRFKLTWFTAFGELMFHEMEGSRVPQAEAAFWDEIAYQANERDEATFFADIRARLAAAIEEDAGYLTDGVFNQPKKNGGEGRNSGLGVSLAALLAEVSFADNRALAPVMARVRETVEDELINAYGHATIACGRFRVV